jgi:hypothetical protein
MACSQVARKAWQFAGRGPWRDDDVQHDDRRVIGDPRRDDRGRLV